MSAEAEHEEKPSLCQIRRKTSVLLPSILKWMREDYGFLRICNFWSTPLVVLMLFGIYLFDYGFDSRLGGIKIEGRGMLRTVGAENAVSVTLGDPAIVVSGAFVAPPALVRSDTDGPADAEPDDSATYLFELLVAARRVAVTRRHKFLAYLIGMAAEEARLLTQGRSAVGGDV